MENITENKEALMEVVLREKRIQMTNEFAEAVVDYGQDHPYPAALQNKFRTFDTFVQLYFGLIWNSANAEYSKPVLKDNDNDVEKK